MEDKKTTTTRTTKKQGWKERQGKHKGGKGKWKTRETTTRDKNDKKNKNDKKTGTTDIEHEKRDNKNDKEEKENKNNKNVKHDKDTIERLRRQERQKDDKNYKTDKWLTVLGSVFLSGLIKKTPRPWYCMCPEGPRTSTDKNQISSVHTLVDRYPVQAGLRIRIRILLSLSKNSKKTLISTVLCLLFDFLSWKIM
jgi:hypothetical protein